jgi:hypothetical protein
MFLLQLLLVAKADELKAGTKLMKGYRAAALANKGKLVFVTVNAVSFGLLLLHLGLCGSGCLLWMLSFCAWTCAFGVCVCDMCRCLLA